MNTYLRPVTPHAATASSTASRPTASTSTPIGTISGRAGASVIMIRHHNSHTSPSGHTTPRSPKTGDQLTLGVIALARTGGALARWESQWSSSAAGTGLDR